MPFFRFRTVLEELEAKLRPPGSAEHFAAVGKSERKRYGNGEEKLTLRAHRLDLPDGTLVEVVISGTVIAERPTERGSVRLELSSGSGPVPAVAEGDVLELRVGARELLSGTYEPD